MLRLAALTVLLWPFTPLEAAGEGILAGVEAWQAAEAYDRCVEAAGPQRDWECELGAGTGQSW